VDKKQSKEAMYLLTQKYAIAIVLAAAFLS
jgi:hypothetical protein